jgi:hypothetical protein
MSTTQLFFRSVAFGAAANNLAVEITGTTFRVYDGTTVLQSIPVTIGVGGIALLRTALTGSPHIEMPVLGYDDFDTRLAEKDTALPAPAGGLAVFPKTFLSGGEGKPTDQPTIDSIRTGPYRTVIVVQTTENATGTPVQNPPNTRVQQWDGEKWVTYNNFTQGTCPP